MTALSLGSKRGCSFNRIVLLMSGPAWHKGKAAAHRSAKENTGKDNAFSLNEMLFCGCQVFLG